MNEGALLQPSFDGSKQRHPMKIEATPNHKGLKTNTSDENRGNTKTQGAQNKYLQQKKKQPQNARGSKQRHLMKKEATPKCKGLKTKTSDEKEATPKLAK
jgi:hypothetical protein